MENTRQRSPCQGWTGYPAISGIWPDITTSFQSEINQYQIITRLEICDLSRYPVLDRIINTNYLSLLISGPVYPVRPYKIQYPAGYPTASNTRLISAGPDIRLCLMKSGIHPNIQYSFRHFFVIFFVAISNLNSFKPDIRFLSQDMDQISNYIISYSLQTYSPLNIF